MDNEGLREVVEWIGKFKKENGVVPSIFDVKEHTNFHLIDITSIASTDKRAIIGSRRFIRRMIRRPDYNTLDNGSITKSTIEFCTEHNIPHTVAIGKTILVLDEETAFILSIKGITTIPLGRK